MFISRRIQAAGKVFKLGSGASIDRRRLISMQPSATGPTTSAARLPRQTTSIRRIGHTGSRAR